MNLVALREQARRFVLLQGCLHGARRGAGVFFSCVAAVSLAMLMCSPVLAGDAVEVISNTSTGSQTDTEATDTEAQDSASVVLVHSQDSPPIFIVMKAGEEDAAGTGITAGRMAVPTDIDEMISYLTTGYVQPDAELSIEDALAIALCGNHDLNSKRLAAAAACQGVKVQWSALRPQLGLQAKGYWQESNVVSEPIEIPVPGGDPLVIDMGTSAPSEFQQSLALSLTQRIYDFGLTNDLIDVASAQHAIQKYTVDMAEQQLVHDVIAAYYRFNLALGQARIHDDELALASEMLRQARIQFDVGVVPRLDVIRAESRVEEARSRYINAQSQVGDAAAYFYSLLGAEDARYVPGIITAPLVEIGAAPLDVNEAIDYALCLRPEVELQYAALFAGEQAVSLTRNRPLVDLYANAMYTDPASAFSGSESYEYGVQMLWNIYTGGKDRAELKQKKLELQSIAEGINHLEAQLELDATTAWNHVFAARASADSAKLTLELAAEGYRAANIGYGAGVTPYIDYLDALDKNVAAAIGYLVSLANVKLAQTNLSRAMGFPYGYPGDDRCCTPDDADIFATLGLTP